MTCGYTVTDRDGNEEPCGKPAQGWRWYQDVEHEDLLDVACVIHQNEGGRRLHSAEATIARVRELTEGPLSGGHKPYAVDLGDQVIFAVGLDDLRAALDGGQP